jgi:hypothetical protein
MVGQVLEISKHENPVITAWQPRPGVRARVYRFPARTPLIEPELKARAAGGSSLGNYFRLHLPMDAAIGLVVWLLWYGWHQLR